jgi:hypothetical protein
MLIGLIFIIPTFSYRRNLPIFTIVTLPIFVSYLEKIRLDLSKYKMVPIMFSICLIALIEYNLFSRFPGFNFYKYNESNYCQYSSKCSVKLANYLLAFPPNGYGINFYDEGGYYIGKNEGFPIFLDGRMHMWIDSDGYYPFADYINMYYHNDFEKFNEYNFDWAILPVNAPLVSAINNGKVKGNWLLRYEDQTRVYYINLK